MDSKANTVKRAMPGFSSRMYEYFLREALVKKYNGPKKSKWNNAEEVLRNSNTIGDIAAEISDLDWLVMDDVAKMCSAYYAHSLKGGSSQFEFDVNTEIMRVAMEKLEETLTENAKASEDNPNTALIAA
mmetsp:Transcript_17000/g.23778  ORF Transcript_17000/g.23778 Transcript_17000/m.23778 type:complete len:129 (+) Transcript_17000:66-452(+)|eukprot:CAMPEP_0184480024 /NCGR_PEP_ID=MMETSP0113_2-20130426/1514_1 /TAXON_ID=91329 /ORGANISM="Norrisiella sphaerica, Strain BC52" /LENGTH=128 /DNA_ID=CAMNT_0026858223 /DNA_START=66 /DNA_END=452 /DNA_ORIENTATION=-